MLGLLIPGLKMGAGAASAPVFAGSIPNISVTENTGTHSYDLSTYFSGATSYSITPAVETGWTFDTGTAELIIDTDDVSVFGPYIVTGTNLAGSADSNGFSVTVAAAAVQQDVSGGWKFLYPYESHLRKRREDERKRQEIEDETEQIPDELDRSIAQLLREQEAIDAKRADLKRLADLAKQNADLEAARRYSEKVAKALEVALNTESTKALSRLDKELRKAREEEEALIMSMMMLLDE